MDIQASLIFNGECKKAFTFYRTVFGGDFSMLTYFSEAPGSEKIAKEDLQKVMYVCLPIGGKTTIMGWDHVRMSDKEAPYRKGTNYRLSITPSSKAEADRLFNALAKGGTIEMPLQDTFWNAYYGSLTDQFGVQWMVNFETKKK